MSQQRSVCVFLANGFEEIEAVTIIDVLRRARVHVTVLAAGPGEGLSRTGAHDITVRATQSVEGVRVADFDAFVLPGGQPGSNNLRDDACVQSLLRQAASEQRLIAAICAAPIALERAGVLQGRTATAFPGVELPSTAARVAERVVSDGNVITSQGPGTALEFALALVERLVSRGAANSLADEMLVPR